MLISLAQAFANWQELAANIPKDDGPMLAESWNNHTDSLAKDGELTALQYHYAPSYDDPMPGEGSRFDKLSDDRGFILDAMGVELTSVASGGPRNGWDAGASHWKCVLTHNGMMTEPFTYSMGSAHAGMPDICDVLNCLLLDASYGEHDFDDYCSELGEDKDSRKAYASCQAMCVELNRLFSSSQLEQLRELFEGM